MTTAAVRAVSCCFTGHRPAKFRWRYNERHPDAVALRARLREAVLRAIDAGFRRFISGMALGVDQWAAEIVANLRDERPELGITLVAAIPCAGQDSLWPAASKERYQALLARADQVHWCSRDGYRPELMLRRNTLMCRAASRIIAVWDGSPGGTAHCVGEARRLGLVIDVVRP